MVTRIGMATEFGKIASLTQNMEESESPLQRQLDRLTKQVTLFAMCMGVAFFLLDVLFVHNGLASSFIFALGMVVAFIPEGLLPTVTLSLAMAVQRMSKRNALVKKLSSVEALGSTSVICTDKTGTLTQNEMTVNHLWTCDREYEVTGVGYAPKGEIRSNGEKWLAADDERAPPAGRGRRPVLQRPPGRPRGGGRSLHRPGRPHRGVPARQRPEGRPHARGPRGARCRA